MAETTPSRHRHRERHGRGMRGALAPGSTRLSRSRTQVFDEIVAGAVDRLERRLGDQLGGTEFLVEDVPPPAMLVGGPGDPPLASTIAPIGARPPQVVVYRRPVARRSGDLQTTRQLVWEVLVDEVAGIVGVDPEDID